VQVVLAVSNLVECIPLGAADPHSSAAPETRGPAEIIRPAIDDEAGNLLLASFLKFEPP